MITRAIILCIACVVAFDAYAATRIKDVVSIRNVRPNQLVGYGLVTGLNGTGDSLRNAPFTEQSMQAMLDRMGVNVRSANTRSRNIAAVMVTAELPAFAGKGSRMDVTVSSIGDATSLSGGSLILTPLYGADNEIYGVAQGPLVVSGFVAQGQAASVTQGVPTSGRVPNGAIVERDAPGDLNQEEVIRLELLNPDFSTAVRVADAVNAFTRRLYGGRLAREQDLRTIAIKVPTSVSPARFIAELGDLMVEPDTPARVIVDERTGTIVIGADVRISEVAVSHGNLTVRVTETPQVSQPNPFSEGETVVVPDTVVTADQRGGKTAIMKGNNLQSLVRGLNKLGLKPQGIIAILQAIKTSGALHADLVVQ